jgi:hypothetical protein
MMTGFEAEKYATILIKFGVARTFKAEFTSFFDVLVP